MDGPAVTRPSFKTRLLESLYPLYRRYLRRSVARLFFMDLVGATQNFGSVTWLGHPIWQNVLDLWTTQEVLAAVKPELLIECGTNPGGAIDEHRLQPILHRCGGQLLQDLVGDVALVVQFHGAAEGVVHFAQIDFDAQAVTADRRDGRTGIGVPRAVDGPQIRAGAGGERRDDPGAAEGEHAAIAGHPRSRIDARDMTAEAAGDRDAGGHEEDPLGLELRAQLCGNIGQPRPTKTGHYCTVTFAVKVQVVAASPTTLP